MTYCPSPFTHRDHERILANPPPRSPRRAPRARRPRSNTYIYLRFLPPTMLIEDYFTAEMGKSKLKKKKKRAIALDLPVQENKEFPIPNLPEKFLWMKVRSTTKIRNVLEYSLKEFPSHKCVVWSGAGQGIGKVITCAEIFKRKHTGLHQITKLRYIRSKNSSDENRDENDKARHVPEIHILLSKDELDIKEPGYQAPGACPMFQNSSEDKSDDSQEAQSSNSRMSNITAEEFAAMGLRTGQKRPRRDNPTQATPKKNKKANDGN